MSPRLALALFAIAPASAQASLTDEVALRIKGHISPRCALDLSRSEVEITLLPTSGQALLPLRVDCNERLAISMMSQNGGLLHPAHARGARYPGFTGFLPYQAAFRIEADGEKPISASSIAMRGAGVAGSTHVIPYRTAGSLYLSWTPSEGLLAGEYRDVIEIRVSGAGEHLGDDEGDGGND